MTKPRLKIVGTIALLLIVLIATVLVATGVVRLLWTGPGPEPTTAAAPTNTPGRLATPTHVPTATSPPAPTLRSFTTPTSTQTRMPTPTRAMTPTPTPIGSATPTTMSRPVSPTPSVTYPAPILLTPTAGAHLIGQQRFTWQWDGPPLGADQAYDLRIWSQQEQETGRPRRGVVPPTRNTEAEVALQFVPAIKDYGVGDYYWTVVVVEAVSGASPRVVGIWGEERKFSYGTDTPSPGPTTTTSPEPPNQAPVASFGYECSGLKCDFDGGDSFDPDGNIVSYSWDFGDGEGGSGQTTSHKFKNAGTYTVVLTVTDNRGTTASQPKNVKVP